MKSTDGKSQRREEKKKEDHKRESLRRKIHVPEKVGKSRSTAFFQWFVAPEAGRQVGSLKRRVPSPLGRWEIRKNCTPLWREDFEVKMYKRTTFGSWDVEKVHAIVARSTFLSEKAKSTARSEHFLKLRCRISEGIVARSTSAPDHFWILRCRKSACRCGAKHISTWKSSETLHVQSPFWSWDVGKVHADVARSTFPSQNVQSTTCSDHLDVQMSFRVAGARDCAPCQKWAKREGFVACPKTMAGVGHLKGICKDAFSVAGAVQETSSSELLGGPGADFLRGVAFWSIRSSGFVAALRMTRYHFFVAGAVV